MSSHHLRDAALVLLSACWSLSSTAAARTALGERVEALTGARTRVVWLKGVNRVGGYNPMWDKHKYRVMVFDSREGVEREIFPAAKTAWARISPDGTKVLFSVSTSEMKLNSEVVIANFDGSGRKVFTSPGYLYDVTRDSATGIDWAYVGDTFITNSIRRHRLDDPSVVEVVFGPDKRYSMQCVVLSGDGKFGIGLWPHPRIRMLDTSDASLGNTMGSGCNLGIAPDDSHRWWTMDGSHRVVHLHRPDGQRIGTVDIHRGGEGMNGREVWNPSWTNKIDVFTLNGPYERLHLAGSDIYVGKFNEALTAVEKFVRITDNDEAETNQHGWVGEPASAPVISKQPDDCTADEGRTVTFSVEADGSPAPEYQWQRDGVKIEGSTDPSLDVVASRTSKDARFRCTVSNSEGRVESREARLAVKLKGPSTEQSARWDARLQAKLRQSLEAGVKPALNPRSKRNRRDVSAIDAQGRLSVQIARGMQAGMSWKTLTADNKASLVLSILRDGRKEDHCLAAYYLLLAGKRGEAGMHLGRCGAEAPAIRAMFE